MLKKSLIMQHFKTIVWVLNFYYKSKSYLIFFLLSYLFFFSCFVSLKEKILKKYKTFFNLVYLKIPSRASLKKKTKQQDRKYKTNILKKTSYFSKKKLFTPCNETYVYGSMLKKKILNKKKRKH